MIRELNSAQLTAYVEAAPGVRGPTELYEVNRAFQIRVELHSPWISACEFPPSFAEDPLPRTRLARGVIGYSGFVLDAVRK